MCQIHCYGCRIYVPFTQGKAYAVKYSKVLFPNKKKEKRIQMEPMEHKLEVYPFELLAGDTQCIICHMFAHLSNPKCPSMCEKQLVN